MIERGNEGSMDRAGGALPRPASVARALTVAGSDSGGGAGIQADLKTFSAFGVFGASAITALTAQNTIGVHAVQLVEPAFVTAQIDAVCEDIGVDAAKTGMLGSADLVRSVAAALGRHGVSVLVVDPVMVATSGDLLLEPDAVAAVRDEMAPLAACLTPNLPEAEALLGTEVRDPATMGDAARDLGRLGPRSVLLKGGHLDGDIVDVLWDGTDVHEWTESRIDSRDTHGTGCTLSAAIAAGLALGWPLLEAVTRARAYVRRAIERAPGLGGGSGPLWHGPEERRP